MIISSQYSDSEDMDVAELSGALVYMLTFLTTIMVETIVVGNHFSR